MCRWLYFRPSKDRIFRPAGRDAMTALRIGVLLLLLTGCRNGPPELKPQKGPEALNVPPQGDARYDRPGYPKEAFNDNKNNLLPKGNNPGPIMPAGGPGQGGMMGRGGF